jgi:deferrochelatase/peroxidase EfeB
MLPKPPFKLNIADVDAYLAALRAKPMSPLSYPPPFGQPDRQVMRFLAELQGNILKPHGRPFARLMVFKFEDAAIAEVGKIDVYMEKISSDVTNALQQYSDARHKCEDNGEKPFRSIVLTAQGLRVAKRALPAESVGVDSFSSGMLKKHVLLGDPSDGDQLPRDWEDVYKNDGSLHGMWLVAHATESGLAGACREVEEKGREVIQFIQFEEAKILRDDGGFAREPFGFRDGISMPEYFVDEESPHGLINPPLEQVLMNSDGVDRCCSFLVFRKLEQNVDGFRAFEESLRISLREKELDERDPGRLLIGRYRDGTPLVSGFSPGGEPDGKLNDFDFKKDMGARGCPFHAHIRKAFFRQPAVDRGIPPIQQESAQFIRRGMLFGARSIRDSVPVCDAKAGLLFMAYMSDIGRQFEKLQAEWFQSGDFPVMGVNQLDPLLFGPRSAGGEWSWAERGLGPLPIGPLVTPLGGAYFFVPSMSWLRSPIERLG